MVAQLAEPCKAYFGSSITSGEQRPIGVVIAALPAPCGEQIQPLSYIGIGVATNVPGSLCAGRAWALRVGDGQIAEAESDIEGGLIEVGRRIHLGDDILSDAVGGVETRRVRAIGRNTHKSHSASARASGRTTNGRCEINASRVARAHTAAINVVLALSKDVGDGHGSPKSVVALHHQVAEDRVVRLGIELESVGRT